MDRIDSIEKEIDALVLNSPLFLKSLPYCVWVLLIMHEEYCRLPILTQRIPLKEIFPYLILVDNAKYALKYSLCWTFQKANPKLTFNSPQGISKDNYSNGVKLFRLGEDYSLIVAAFTNYRRKKAIATLINDKTIRFTRPGEERRYEVLEKIISWGRQDDAVESSKNSFITFVSNNDVLQTIIESVHQISLDGIDYKLIPENVKELSSLAEDIIKPSFLFPSNWEFRGIPISTFRKVWSYLVAWCLIHRTAHMAAAYGGIKGGAYATTVIVKNKFGAD
jgi:hypothetical protein